MDMDKKALELRKSDISFCKITIIKADGSSPRKAGSKMLVCADGTSYGSIGGGAVEYAASQEAMNIIESNSPKCVEYDLTDDGIQPCGGKIEVFFEPVSINERIIIFGAGHISEKLCPMLAEMEFSITLVDERYERLSLPAFKSATRINSLPSDFLNSFKPMKNTYIICMTHMHAHDEEIVERTLGKPFKYFGLISSRSKWSGFRKKFLKNGYSEEDIEQITTPIGLDIGGDTPMEIAIAIAAQIIQLKHRPDDFKIGVAHFAKEKFR